MSKKQSQKTQLDSNEMERYSRHLILKEIGTQGQKKLKSASVLCVGSGGLGSPVLVYLAAAGIGKIGIIDFDLVESSNLNRQIIHSTSSIGCEKAISAQLRVLDINPNCQVDVFTEKLTRKNALNIMEAYDIICDGTDNFPSRYLINDACLLLNKPNIYGSVHQFEGQATVFNLTKSSPNYRDLIPIPPPPGQIPSCAEAGVMGVVPGIIGLIQATEIIKIITGTGEPLDGRLLVFDALKMRFRELKLLASEDKYIAKDLIDYEEFCGLNVHKREPSPENIKNISIKELINIMNSNSKEISLIDVREHHEAQITSIPGSKLVPLDSIRNGSAINLIRNLEAKSQLYFHCKSGKRSIKALEILKGYGITGTNIIGGIDAWNKVHNS